MDSSFFGPLKTYIDDPDVTDLDFNGNDLWITDLKKGKYRVLLSGESTEGKSILPAFTDRESLSSNFTDEEFSDPGEAVIEIPGYFWEQLVQKVANLVSRQFNKRNPVLEAETESLRITILHESAAKTGRCVSIRKTPRFLRMNAFAAIQQGYCSREIMAFLVNSVQAHMNLVFCGLPGAGKTESLKFFASFISQSERVITVEDTLEIHYSSIHPEADAVEMRVNQDIFSYTDAIRTGLRLNPTWLMLSEARSSEVKYLLESWSTGIHGMTTIHTGDVRNLPDRVMNMYKPDTGAERIENDIYTTVDAAVLLRSEKLENGGVRRWLDQLCFYHRSEKKNEIIMAVSEGKWILEELPEFLVKKMEDAGITDPFASKALEQRIREETIGVLPESRIMEKTRTEDRSAEEKRGSV